ncbi:hypothetical protein GALMADRAFT_136599 [Galerina marginata CBS 339.88]|uniref:Protein kinase domain-containing protein n=1 Tax=Galerina marginata (strain CBS 339.88) TaxID=685588 RepID=A0A067TM69_GALM3|nr:hypothetical protein GALMADRAFT_136599 [Galerina marginata CBS 339.88]
MTKTAAKKSSLTGSILPSERFWIDLQPFLLERGYKLRPRYDPNWTPSWEKPWNFKDPASCPDGISRSIVLDAIRVSDGTKVALKKVNIHSEVPLLRVLSSPELLADFRNNTVPILDVIPLPNDDVFALIVMPVLYHFDSPFTPFRHASEVLEAIEQFAQGLAFLHEYHIAHRDMCYLNLMMDPTKVIPGGFHFARKSFQDDLKNRIVYHDRRSVAPVRYYFIDYETAQRFSLGEQCVGIMGQERNVPEMSDTVPYDPFKLDVYQLGAVILRLIENYEGLEILKPLAGAMTDTNPEKRLTAADSVQKFQELVSPLTEDDLSQKIWLRSLSPEDRLAVGFPVKNPFWYRYFEFLCCCC